jgi:ribonuclease Z
MVWNITKDKITERMTVSPDQAWSVAGPTKPPAPPTSGVADPLSDKMKAGRWNPQASDAQKELVDTFKKKYKMK